MGPNSINRGPLRPVGKMKIRGGTTQPWEEGIRGKKMGEGEREGGLSPLAQR